MPPRILRDQPADVLAKAYADVFDRLARLEAQAFDPANWRKLARVRALQARVLHEVEHLDVTARAWVKVRLPGVYEAGSSEFARLMRSAGVESRFEWTQLHREGLRAVAGDSLDYLLAGNGMIEARARDAIREIVRSSTVAKIATGDVPREQAREIAARMRDELGFTKIPDRRGRLMRVDTYAETVARTQSALAYNRGEIVQAVEERVEWLEVFDGTGCGWSTHTDGDLANGSVRTVEDAAAYPIAHPRCLRSFGPRPDLGLARSRRELADRVEFGARLGQTPAMVGAARRGESAARERRNAARRAVRRAVKKSTSRG